MNDQIYYVARRAAEFDSPLAALLSVGYTVPAAQLVIDNARLEDAARRVRKALQNAEVKPPEEGL